MKPPFLLRSILLFLSLFSACKEKRAFSFYTQYISIYPSYKAVRTELQKQEFKKGAYFLEVKDIVQPEGKADSTIKTSLYILDSNYLAPLHQLKISLGESGFTFMHDLYTTGAKNFEVEGRTIEVVRYRTAGMAYDCCMSYDVHFWSPEFGLISTVNINGAFEIITDMVGERREYLHKPTHFSAREALKRMIFQDRAFYYHADSSQLLNVRNGNCMRPNTKVDDCEPFHKLVQIIRNNLKYPKLPVPACYPAHTSSRLQFDQEGNVCLQSPYFFYLSIRGLEGYSDYFAKEAILAITHLPESITPLTHEGIPVEARVDLPFEWTIPDSLKCLEIIKRRKEEG